MVKALGDAKFLVQAAAHGVSQGVLSVMQGGDFISGAAGGFFGSLGSSAFGAIAGEWATSAGGQIFFGALSGGIGAELSGGNFWQGAVTGGIVAGLNHAMHMEKSNLLDDGGDDPPKVTKIKRVKSKDRTHSLSRGSRGGQSIITPENPNNQVGNGVGIFVPTGSESMISANMTFLDNNTVNIDIITQASRINTSGSYISGYDIVAPNGKIIESRFLNYRNYRRMDFPVFTSRGSAPVLSTARFKNIPVSSTITIRVGLTYKIPAGSIGAISTKHIIKVR